MRTSPLDLTSRELEIPFETECICTDFSHPHAKGLVAAKR